jgi:hypothetical protein
VGWILIILIAAGVAVLARIFASLRKLRNDFFFALPSEAACAQVQRALETEGFNVDAKAVPETADHPFSLHASKALRLSIPDMRELTQRFSELAGSAGGRYDGWAAADNPQRFSV